MGEDCLNLNAWDRSHTRMSPPWSPVTIRVSSPTAWAGRAAACPTNSAGWSAAASSPASRASWTDAATTSSSPTPAGKPSRTPSPGSSARCTATGTGAATPLEELAFQRCPQASSYAVSRGHGIVLSPTQPEMIMRWAGHVPSAPIKITKSGCSIELGAPSVRRYSGSTPARRSGARSGS